MSASLNRRLDERHSALLKLSSSLAAIGVAVRWELELLMCFPPTSPLSDAHTNSTGTDLLFTHHCLFSHQSEKALQLPHKPNLMS